MQVGKYASEAWNVKEVTMQPKDRQEIFEKWVEEAPEFLKRDPLWRFELYPKALFFYDLVWEDCQGLMRDVRGRAIAQQLIRSAGSICANIEEGFGRGYGKEYGYFLRISMGSARESRGWYYRARALIPEPTLAHRFSVIGEIISMLAPNIQRQYNYRKK